MTDYDGWRYYPPTGTKFFIPARDGTKTVVVVVWRDDKVADLTVGGEKRTVDVAELDDLYRESNEVELPRRITRRQLPPPFNNNY